MNSLHDDFFRNYIVSAANGSSCNLQQLMITASLKHSRNGSFENLMKLIDKMSIKKSVCFKPYYGGNNFGWN